MTKSLGQPTTRGRKTTVESRSAEFRQSLLIWKQTPAAFRPSLRALARALDTSHQLLTHYLAGLEKWLYDERYRKAKKESDEICARAKAENRNLTYWEEQQVRACDRALIQALVGPALLDTLEDIKREAKRGPLHRAQFKTLKIFAKQGFPGAQELLQKCSQSGLKKRKSFAEIVREAPRQAGETSIAWVRRIWDECAKYATKCPNVITDELLQGCSRGGAKGQRNNLPAISARAAKSFRSA
jgi:hypothetical protein